MTSRGLAVSSSRRATSRRKPIERKMRPVGFTKDGRLRVGSYSQGVDPITGRWYELRVSDKGQLMCGPEEEECRGWRGRGTCGHVMAGALFLETHPCFSEEQKRFERLTRNDMFRRAYRLMRQAEYHAACNGGGPIEYTVSVEGR